jgi:hypothetical protein
MRIAVLSPETFLNIIVGMESFSSVLVAEDFQISCNVIYFLPFIIYLSFIIIILYFCYDYLLSIMLFNDLKNSMEIYTY